MYSKLLYTSKQFVNVCDDQKNIFTENLPFDDVFQRVTKVGILTYILN